MSWRFWPKRHTSKPEPTYPPGMWVMSSGLVLENTHPVSACAHRRACVLHRPSGHAQSGFPMGWRNDRGIFERFCPCGIGHPDADQYEYWVETGQEEQMIHGCCRIKDHC